MDKPLGENEHFTLARWMGGIDEKISTLIRAHGEDRTASAQYRSDIRSELAALSTNVQAFGSELRETRLQVAEMRPDWQDYRLRRAQAQGMTTAVRVLWVIVSGVLFGFLAWLLKVFKLM